MVRQATAIQTAYASRCCEEDAEILDSAGRLAVEYERAEFAIEDRRRV